MSADRLTSEARAENAAMLAAALGIALDHAAEELKLTIAVTASETDASAMAVGAELVAILGRTVEAVELNAEINDPQIEVVLGDATPRSESKILHVGLSRKELIFDIAPISSSGETLHPILCVLAACYSSAAAMSLVFGDRLPSRFSFPTTIKFAELAIDLDAISSPIDIGQTYLAGAGAIGNAFLWAARHLNFHGELHVTDDDVVSSGNLNRQIWFEKKDIKLSKAEILSERAQPFFKNLKIVPRSCRLQGLPEITDGPWLKRLIVAVDSRRARRKLQNEFPGEVFDASTTDIREIVIHHNKQPTANACLSCIYESDEVETSREAHIAEHLGVSVEDVRQERISEVCATTISSRFPHLHKDKVVGVAYDTLFKQLCGERELRSLEGRRVVAPFAFVSVLAGVLLALELVRRLGDGESKRDFNYWRVSPWHALLSRRQICRPKEEGCEFCGDTILAAVNASLWRAIG